MTTNGAAEAEGLSGSSPPVALSSRQAREFPCPVVEAVTAPRVRIAGDGEQAETIDVTFVEVSEDNVAQLRQLNLAIFPIKYPEVIYKQCLLSGPVSQLAFCGDKLIGGIACRLEARKDGPGARLHIMTLGVLAGYRSMGLGSLLVQRTLCQARDMGEVYDVFLHVQVDNDAALEFYQNLGFQLKGKVPGYYSASRDLVGAVDAYLLRRYVGLKIAFPDSP